MSATAAAAAGGLTAASGAGAAAGVQPRSDKGGSSVPTKLCTFCGGDAGAYGGHLGRMQGPFFTSSKGHDAVYVHHECALWSPNITVDAWNRLQSVVREVRRARNLRCSVCDKPGAALGCRVPSCSRCFHLPCAIEHGCWFNFEMYLMSCEEHSALFKKEPAGRQGRTVAGPLRHLKLSSRHLLSGLPKVFAGTEAAAAAAAVLGNSSAGAGRRRARAVSAGRRRNRMSAEELGGHMAAAEEAYLGLVDELKRGEESEDDEAVFARKNVKRFRKAEQLLAPTLLHPPAAKQRRQPQPQHPQQLPAPSAQQLLPPEAQQRYLQHMQQTERLRQQQKKLARQPQAPPQQQQQQHEGWQPSSEGFKGVGGLDDAKRQLREMVLMPLTYPDLYKSLGIHPPRGILLHGPPGTGKTALVRALAAECAALAAEPTSNSGGSSNGSTPAPRHVALFARKGTDCLGKYAGDAELHLRMLFEMAAASAPSIIFLDELDGLVPARSVRSGGSDQIFASIVSVLLTLMDGLTDRGQVLVIGATNRPDNIDPALRRPGRFDREVLVGLPGTQHRADILALHTAKWTPPPTRQQLELMAAQTEGWAGADLQSLAASALLAAVRRITPQLLDSMDRQQRQQRPRQQAAGALGVERKAVGSNVHGTAPNHAAVGLTAVAPADCAAGSLSSDDTHSVAGGLAASGQQQQQQLAQSAVEAGPAAALLAAADATDGPAGAVLGAAAAAAALPDAGTGDGSGGGGGGGGFLAALQEFVTAKAGPTGFLFSPPRIAQPGTQQQQQQQAMQQPQGSHQQQAPGANAEQVLQLQQQLDHQSPPAAMPQQSQPTPSGALAQQHARLSPALAPALPPRVPRPRTGGRTRSPSAPAALPAALQHLQVLAYDWATALSELGPPASKRGSHNLPALSPAASLPAPLVPLLLPALTQVVDVLHSWLLLGPQDGADWQQAMGGTAGLQDDSSSSQQAVGAAGGAAAGGSAEPDGRAAVAELLVSWAAVESMPGGSTTTTTAAAAAATGAADGNTMSDVPGVGPAAVPVASGALLSCSSLLGAGALQHGSSSSSSTPRCLLLSGHGAEGQSEVAAATLKLLDSRAGACVYTLSLPVMLLLGEGSASAGLVSGVREALGRTSSTQHLVIYLPRLELWALEASKPAKAMQSRKAAAAAAAVAAVTVAEPGSRQPQQTLGGWSSGLRGAFSGDSSSSSDGEVSDADGADGASSDAADDLQQQQDANNASADYSWGGPGAPAARRSGRKKQQQQEPVLQFSVAWSVFEQQLAMLHSQQRLLILATTQLPVEELPHEMQQLFGWQQQPQQQQQQQQRRRLHATAATGADSSGGLRLLSCSSSRTVQVCDRVDAGACSAAAVAAVAALRSALDTAMQVAASALHSDSGSGDSSRDTGNPVHKLQASTSSSKRQPGQGDTSSSGADGPDSLRQQQAPVDALIAAALQQKEQQQRQLQRQLPARVPTQQMLAAQQLGAPLQQLNDAQRAEAQTLLNQVQAALKHIASTVLQDPRLQLTQSRQHARTQTSTKGPAASISLLPVNPQQQQQQMLSAVASGMATRAVRQLEVSLPVGAVCVKALQGWYWGLDAFQADFSAAVDTVRGQQQSPTQVGHSCASAAAATLDDVVAAACHEARHRLRLYEHSRQQLLEAAALAQLSVQQQHDLQQQQQQQQRHVFKVPRQRAPAGQVTAGNSAAGVEVSQHKQQQPQQQLAAQQEASGTTADGRRGCEVPAALPSAAAAASLANKSKSSQQLTETLYAEAEAVVEEAFGASDSGSDLACCPAAAAYAAFDRFCKTLHLTSTAFGL